jgi:hypothetical protein
LQEGSSEQLNIAGDVRMVKELMLVKKQVHLLKHCCQVLRGDVAVLQEEIRTSTEWVFNSAHDAIARQCQCFFLSPFSVALKFAFISHAKSSFTAAS